MANLRDVARGAGVSIATVSRVINQPDNVRPQTRNRVQNAIKILRYKPSRVARRLRTQDGRAHMLGIIVPDIQNPFFSEIVRGVEDVAYEHDYALLLCNSDEDVSKEKFYFDVMRSESVDGVILHPVHEAEKTVDSCTRPRLPLVCVDRSLTEMEVDAVVVDNRQGAFEAVELLIHLGHRRIGFISGLPHISTSKERRLGYEQALDAHDIEWDGELICIGDWRQESGRLLAGKLLDMARPPSAIFPGNNLMTLGALEAIQARGLNIPQDVAIVGFDDMPWAALLNPPLTVVRQPGYEMGRRAVEMLFYRIAEPNRPTAHVVLKTTLVVRRSCGSLPADGECASLEAQGNEEMKITNDYACDDCN